MGLSQLADHVAPHAYPTRLTPVITFLPFRMSAAILRAHVSLDFLGLGVPAIHPVSLGELLRTGQGQPRCVVDHRLSTFVRCSC